MASIKDHIKSNSTLKKLVQWLMIPPHDYRPRLWMRLFVNPFFHKKSRHAIIRWSARLDVFPYNSFEVGAYSIIESHTLISNGVGNVLIGEKVLIGAGSKIIGPIKFGNNILVAQNVLISGLNHDFDDVTKPIVLQGFSKNEIVVEDGVWIGAGAIITAGVTIGQNAVVGAGSVVTKNVEAFSVVVGNPARMVKKFDFKVNKWVKMSTTTPILT